MHRSQRLAQLAAQLRCRLAKNTQNFFLARRRHLFLGERIAALDVRDFQAQNVVAAQAGDGAGNVRLAPRPLA
jgi:hypothetical protein